MLNRRLQQCIATLRDQKILPFTYQWRIIMSKSHDTKKEGKKPATKTAKEKHDAKKAKKTEQAHREF